MRQQQSEIRFQTQAGSMLDITQSITDWCRDSGIKTGILTLFIRHTSASLVIQENADPDVQHDLINALERLAPRDNRLYRHTTEGADDMPAHVKSALTSTNLSIPVAGRLPVLGTWQGIYIMEHRATGHQRTIVAHLCGE